MVSALGSGVDGAGVKKGQICRWEERRPVGHVELEMHVAHSDEEPQQQLGVQVWAREKRFGKWT